MTAKSNLKISRFKMVCFTFFSTKFRISKQFKYKNLRRYRRNSIFCTFMHLSSNWEKVNNDFYQKKVWNQPKCKRCQCTKNWILFIPYYSIFKEEIVMLCIYFYIKTWFDCCQKCQERKKTWKVPNCESTKTFHVYVSS